MSLEIFFVLDNPFLRSSPSWRKKTDPFCIKKITKTFFLATHQKKKLTPHTVQKIGDGSSFLVGLFFCTRIRIIKGGVRVLCPPFHYPPVLFRGGCYFLLLYIFGFFKVSFYPPVDRPDPMGKRQGWLKYGWTGSTVFVTFSQRFTENKNGRNKITD